MRLGQLLQRLGVIDAERLATALRQQVVYGGRLGTNLIELGYASHDDVAHALARLHRVPAVLARHLARHDAAAQKLISWPLAARLVAFPVAFAMAGGRQLVVALRDPADREAVADLRREAGLPVVAAAAPELSIHQWLERAYGVDPQQRFAYSSHGGASPLPGGTDSSDRLAADDASTADDSIDIDLDLGGGGDDDDDEVSLPAALTLVDLDDHEVERAATQHATDSKRRSSLWEQAGVRPPAHLSPPPAARAVSGTGERPAPAPCLRVDEAEAAIAAATRRAEVSDAVVGFMRGRFGAGLILVARDGIALGYRGFGGTFDDKTVESIVVPLSVPSVFRRAHDTRQSFRGAPAHEHPVQDRFFKLFPLERAPAEVVVAPVLLRDRVVCLFYAHGRAGGALDDAAVGELERLAGSTAAAYLELIRRSKRAQATG